MPPRCLNPGNPAANDPGYLHYVEPYFGGGSVLLANSPEGISEVANDLNGELSCFWRVLQNEYMFSQFAREIQATPFSEAEFIDADLSVFPASEPVACAINFFIRCRMSLAGRMKGFTGITKTRTRRGMNNEVSAWLTCVDGLQEVHERMKRVLILNKPALEVIISQDGPRSLFYVDPPYLHSERVSKDTYGEFEMDEDDHEDLLCELVRMKGRFLLSGYRSKLYDRAAEMNGWTRVDFELPNNAAGGKTKRRMVESVWRNY